MEQQDKMDEAVETLERELSKIGIRSSHRPDEPHVVRLGLGGGRLDRIDPRRRGMAIPTIDGETLRFWIHRSHLQQTVGLGVQLKALGYDIEVRDKQGAVLHTSVENTCAESV